MLLACPSPAIGVPISSGVVRLSPASPNSAGVSGGCCRNACGTTEPQRLFFRPLASALLLLEVEVSLPVSLLAVVVLSGVDEPSGKPAGPGEAGTADRRGVTGGPHLLLVATREEGAGVSPIRGVSSCA